MPISGAEAPWRPGQEPNKYERPPPVNHYFPFFSFFGRKSGNHLNLIDFFWSLVTSCQAPGAEFQRFRWAGLRTCGTKRCCYQSIHGISQWLEGSNPPALAISLRISATKPPHTHPHGTAAREAG